MTLQQDFVENLRRIFPLLTSARLSKWADVSARTCQRWLKGEEIGVPQELQSRAEQQLALVEQAQLEAKASSLIVDMLNLGVDPDVVISNFEYLLDKLENEELGKTLDTEK